MTGEGQSERARRALLAAIVVIASIFLTTRADSARAAADPTLVAIVQSTDLAPRTNGQVIVYNTRPGSMDIYAIGIHGGKPFPIATGKGDQVLVGISGDWVLWYESSDAPPYRAIRAMNLATRKVATISGDQGAESAAISGDWVAWTSQSGSGDERQSQLFVRNLATMAPARLLPVSLPRVDIWPLISGDRVVWVEMDRSDVVLNGPRTDRWRLRELNLTDPRPLTIAEGSETSHCTQVGADVVACALQSGSMIGAVSLNGPDLSYVETMFDGHQRSVARDLDSGRIIIVGGNASELICYGHYALWSGATEQPSQIHAFDLTSGQSLTLVDDAGLNLGNTTAFSTGAGWLVWERAPAGVFKSKPNTEELHAARVDGLLASAVSNTGEPMLVFPTQAR